MILIKKQGKICRIVIFYHKIKEYFISDDINNNKLCSLYGVLDGHGGNDVAEHCKISLPKVNL